MPSRSGTWPRNANPPLSSPAISAFNSPIRGPMCLNPTAVSYTSTPYAPPILLRACDAVTPLIKDPRQPFSSSKYHASNEKTSSVVTNRPPSSIIPTRSASPSNAIPTDAPAAGTRAINSPKLGAIGSGCNIPGKAGLRCPRSSSTTVALPPSNRGKYPAPDPYIASVTTRNPAPRIASKSTSPAN